MHFRDVKGKKVTLPKEFNWRPAVYGLLRENNQVLIMKPDWDDKYCLPGGSMELGETPVDALKREFLEETGFTIKVKNDTHPYVESLLFGSPQENKYFQRISLYYEVERTTKKQSKVLDTETVALHWKKLDSLKSADFTFFQKKFMITVLQK